MKKVILLALAGMILLTLPLYAAQERSRLGLGAYAGTLTSAGYSMRYVVNKLGVQGTLGAFTTKDIVNLNMGLNLIGVIDEFPIGRFYALAGGSYRYFSDDYDLTEVNHRWTVGAGLGVELIPLKNVRVALDLPITYDWRQNLVMWIPMGGIYYYFK